MSTDNELEAWRRDWTAQELEVPDLAGRVKRQSRLMRWVFAVEVLITVLIGGGITALAVSRGESDLRWLAAGTWVFLGVAWGFGIWTRKGAWNPAALTTSAYLEISIRRCRSAIRTSAFAMVFFTVETLFCVGWMYNRIGSAGFLLEPSMLVFGAVTLIFFAWAALYRARKRRELHSLLAMEGALETAL